MEFLVDSHCHLHYDYAPKSVADVVRESHANNVRYLVTVATDLASFDPIETISNQHENVFHTIGVHPHDTAELSGLGAAGLDLIRNRLKNPKCKAIGEIGLDYYYKHSDPIIQKKCLTEQLEIALEFDLPVVIHAREAESDLFPLLKSFAKKSKRQIPGAIHCFTGTQTFGQQCLDIGFLISFSGILTFKNAEPLRLAAATFPLERLMVETDCPYLAPLPFRGKKCEPSMIEWTARKLAEIKTKPYEEIVKVTSQNACRFFNIGSHG